MCMGEKDVTVIPKETAHFGFHPNGDGNTVVPVQELDVYTKNQLPLKVRTTYSNNKYSYTK